VHMDGGGGGSSTGAAWRSSDTVGRREACEALADTLADEILQLERLGRRREEREAAEAQIQHEIARSHPTAPSARQHARLPLTAAVGGATAASDGGPDRVAAWVAEFSPRRAACEEVANTLADALLRVEHRATGRASSPSTRAHSPARHRAATPAGLSMEWAVRVDAALSDLTATQRANAGSLRRQLADVELESMNSHRQLSSPSRSASSLTAAGHRIARATSLPLASEFPVSATASTYYVSPLTGTAAPTALSPSEGSPRRSIFSGAALQASRSTSEPQRRSTSPARLSRDQTRRRPQPFLSIDLQRPGAASSAEIRAQLHSCLSQTSPLSTLSRLSERISGSAGAGADDSNGDQTRAVFSASSSASSASFSHASVQTRSRKQSHVERSGRLHRCVNLQCHNLYPPGLIST
jgi:hypothetical protein